MKIARCTLAALGAALLATSAFAQGPATKVSKDSNTPQATFPLAGQNDASGAFHYRNISEGLQADGKTPQAWYVDQNGLGHISVDASILPAGAATSLGQTTANGFLGQLAGAVNGTNINVNCISGCSGGGSGGSVTVTSSALPTGATTAAAQLQQLAAEQAIQANTGSSGALATTLGTLATHTDATNLIAAESAGLTATQLSAAGLATASGQTQAHADALALVAAEQAGLTSTQLSAAGLATATGQATAHTDAAAISGNQADQTGSGSLALGTLNATYAINLTAGRGTVGLNVASLTGTGAVLTPQAENGPGAPWVTINAVVPQTGSFTSAISADGNYAIAGGGHYAVRLLVGTAASAASNATITYDATTSANVVRLGAPILEQNSAAIAANQLGTANFTPGQAAPTTTATVIAAARVGRRSITIENTSTTPIYLGGSGVTPTTGFLLPGQIGASVTISTAAGLYGVTGSGTAGVNFYELY